MNSAGTESPSGSLTNGTRDNIRWEVTAANTGSGTFNVLIRRGDDRTNDKIILINRGWVSEGYRDPNKRKFSLQPGIIIVNGIIRYPQKKGYFVPENDGKNGFWFTIKPVEIFKFLNINSTEIISNYYIDALRVGEKMTLPIGVSGKQK